MPSLHDYGQLGPDGLLWITTASGRAGVSPDTDMTDFAMFIYYTTREALEGMTADSAAFDAMPRAKLYALLSNLASDLAFAEELLVEATPEENCN